VGHTSTYSPINDGGDGVTLSANGEIFAGSSQSSGVMLLNRENSDGNILTFRKDGTTVGSIQSRAGVVSTIVLDPRSGGGGLTGGGAALYPTDKAGSPNDGYLTLGDASSRFNNLYLSGGVYLGGTGAANYLDDYEEGSFTPMTSTLAVVYHARYTKIGNLVTINCSFSMNSGQSRNFIQLPFIPANDGVGKNNATNDSVNNRYAGTVSYFTPSGGSTPVNLMLWQQGNQGAAAYFISKSSDTQQSWPKTVDNTFGVIGVSFTYQTNS